ncbi:phosphoglucosamine mutase [Methylobacillus gramineus]|uniref:phosphoglucosamine mutase n=1 Tax=Methylobacillus gramineus TaxID=755169 RepID=UPI001CFF9760|nr:phosphoglucosamine mutase [Methylobacillus gramineus]MCB5184873.1 phosphoglucosamine mutase [Methylobacillus gramineus]
MSRKYFGTDGIRGRVGEFPITPDFVMRLGYAAGRVLTRMDHHLVPGTKPTVIIGKDTRISGYMFESALQAGLCAAGVNVRLTGPLPTPAIAHITRAQRAQAGVVISASHNPFEDNGIKFFSAQGTKLPDEVELAIEDELEKPMALVVSEQLGRVKRIDDAAGRYIEFCKSTFPNAMDLRGLKIVLDCAHGATYHVAPPVFHELGAEVISIGNQPNGLNINLDAGSTHPEALCKAVVDQQADLGIAFDGDGDRVVMVDSEGNLLDGDQLLYIIAMHRKQRDRLGGGVVGTLMTNLALEHALAKAQIPFQRAKVGDRYVLELLNANGWQVGGENSGHILCLDKHSSGDGIIAALQVLFALRASNQTLAQLRASLPLYPQVLINVKVAQRLNLDDNVEVQAAVQSAEQTLNGNGRVLLRASGTEPKIRVMVEGQDQVLVQALAEKIAAVVKQVTS